MNELNELTNYKIITINSLLKYYDKKLYKNEDVYKVYKDKMKL